MAKKPIYIKPRTTPHLETEWIIKTAGSKKALRVCKTVQEARKKGIELATKRKTTLIELRPNGTVRSKDTYPAPTYFGATDK